MRTIAVAAAACLAFAVCLPAQIAPWQKPPAPSGGQPAASTSGTSERRLDLDLQELPLETVVGMVSEGTPKNIILGQSRSATKVTAHFRNATAGEILRSLAATQQMELVETAESFILVPRDEFMSQYAQTKVVPVAHAAPVALQQTLSQTVDLKGALVSIAADPRSRVLVLRGKPERVEEVARIARELDGSLDSAVLQIDYAAAKQVAEQLRQLLLLTPESLGSVVVDERANRLIVTETPANIERARTLVESVDVPVESRVFSTGKIDPKILAEQIEKVKEATPGTDGASRSHAAGEKVQVIEGTNQIIITDTPERLAMLEKIVREIEGNLATEIFVPNNSLASEYAALLKEAFPQVTAATDVRTNALVLTGHRAEVERAVALLKDRDAVAKTQVVIEARILLVGETAMRDIGVRLYSGDLDGLNESLADVNFNSNVLADSVKPNGSAIGAAPGSTVRAPTKTTGNFLEVLQPNIETNAVIRALEADRQTELISNPTLRMLSGNSSVIFSGSRQPYRETSTQNQVTTENVEFIDVGVTFEVTPNVSPGDVLTLDVKIEFSSLAEVREGIPVVETRRANSLLDARDGETIFLGGLISRDSNNRKAGLPFLSRLPAVGNFFGETRQRAETRELVIILRPRIERNTPDAAPKPMLPDNFKLAPKALEREAEGWGSASPEQLREVSK